MKKTTTITFLFLASILFLSNTIKKPSININLFVDTKWRVDDTTRTVDLIENATICFKKDRTFWHYRTHNAVVDSFQFSNWGVENEKLYLSDKGLIEPKFAFMKIISCNKNCMLIEDLKRNKLVKLVKIFK